MQKTGEHESRIIWQIIEKSKDILLTTHHDPDGDALGSLTAFTRMLFKLGKNPIPVLEDIPKNNLRFLPHLDDIKSAKQVLNKKWDAALVLDCQDLERSGIVALQKANQELQAPLINIDHHAGNRNFGQINLVDGSSPSTTTILFHLFRQYTAKLIDARIATCLLTGVLTDTGNLTNAATSSEAFTVAGELISKGGLYHRITEATFREREFSALKMWGKAFERLAIAEKFNTAYTVLLEEDIISQNAERALDGMANFLNSLHGVKFVLVLREERGLVKGSLRTTRDDVDVARLARLLGGGGHRRAAGFTISGRLQPLNKHWQVV